ncbi:hypothetical protein GIB67_036214 [Kingdonia uniflora]|uniref:C2 domain-containing protein n=1 Tax=Kingdonia uniflora TaxID=39325 RepID=A0A7J7NWS2_9MAGN|nr:hypothetical protein GIB67_036214 [Kingdonia uniflora]
MTFIAAPAPLVPFQLLEINVISAQDLAPVTRGMCTYAVAWVHPRRKLSTRLDTDGHVNPTWNDKFVFRVDEAFLRSDTSAVMIEIYSTRCFRDVRVGSVRILVGNLIPPAARSQYNGTTSSNPPGMRFVALQVRRPSGRPQGILNIGVTILDGSMRSMPLYTQLSSSAVGYRDLMGEENHSPNHHLHHLHQYNKNNLPLRRTRSERASNVTDSDFAKLGLALNGSDIGEPPLATVTTGSFWSESDLELRPSAVAGAAEELFPVTRNVLENWGEDDASVEDLKTKLERWRTELPPIYDRGVGNASISKARHGRRQTDGGLVGGPGLLSCFGDSYGFECSVSCGLKPKKSNGRRKADSMATKGGDMNGDVDEWVLGLPRPRVCELDDSYVPYLRFDYCKFWVSFDP